MLDIVETKAARRPAKVAVLLRSLVLVSALALGACASDKDDLALDDTPAEVLFNEGLALRNAGRLSDAGKKFSELDKLYPYSEYARKSLINLAFINFSLGRYPEAIAASERFTTLYPGSEDSAYALYIIGQSYFRQIPDVTRDQEQTEKALSALNELIRRYPDSEYTADAKSKVLVAYDQLAGKEMQVGRYYLDRRNYIAAINRFKMVVINYQTTRHVEEALFRLTESYYALGVVNEAQTAAAVLGHNYPDSRWYKDAFALLKKGGYEPSENRGSWISRAFNSVKIL
ncbi:outer membrane protein assembly factor BamD [Polymorphum gilvum]|uniref:Outer membrane protein assembly factor BamD n=1 Tax=Polymorphum gilvum (strain LMG 25793 / CGMCC 1.9160 / SL003B-26A1) TaxID=991905 RepID=F2J287_POLGS|nr:outer membrane protein assembly factor BamD [Polymorphum gilvum]ADZ69783.1 DNA uptake lipoprotein-like protein [Polymorphum gilvum SL003B-26A1]